MSAIRREKFITLLPLEVEALGNMYVNKWPAERMFSRSPGKWQVRVPVPHIAPTARFLMTSGKVAFFETLDKVEQQAVIPVEVGELLYIDEPCTVLDVSGPVVTFQRNADKNVRTVRDEVLAGKMAKLKGKLAPRPLPMLMAREERLKVRGIRCQLVSQMTREEAEAEGAPISNLTSRGNYITNATRLTGFLWQIWGEKFPHLAGKDSWAFVLDVERFWP